MAHRAELIGLTPGLHRDRLRIRDLDAAKPGDEPLHSVCLARMTDFTVHNAGSTQIESRLPAGLENRDSMMAQILG